MLDLEHPRNDAEQIFSQQNFKDFFEENGIRKHLFSRSTDVWQQSEEREEEDFFVEPWNE